MSKKHNTAHCMDKSRQKYLQKWLKAQQQPIKKLMGANIALATLSSLILVAQTYFLAILLDQLIMQQASPTTLWPYFLGLIAGRHFMDA